MDGVIVVDKATGWTSHDVVARFRRIARTKKVGHLGTLDPIATGVLLAFTTIHKKTSGPPSISLRCIGRPLSCFCRSFQFPAE